MDNEKTSQTNKYWDSFLKTLPFVQWSLTIIIAIFVFGIGLRDTQKGAAQTLQEVTREQENLRRTIDERKTESDRMIQEVKTSSVTREVFEERTKAIQDEQIRQGVKIDRILERMPN